MPLINARNPHAIFFLLGSICRVSAHAFVQGIVIGGEFYPGFNPSAAPYQHPPPPSIGWANGATHNEFVPPHDYANDDIICHIDATPANLHATVEAGSAIELQWSPWPAESHKGPLMSYMAKCDGECETVDKTELRFFKIAEAALINVSPPLWASEQLQFNNNSWTVNVPKSIAPGKYVLRNEIIALHSANQEDGAQNYPQCINLEVTGTGTENPAGYLPTTFYNAKDPGILFDLYEPFDSYSIPGPPVVGGSSSGSDPGPGSGSGSSGNTNSAIPIPSSSAKRLAPQWQLTIPSLFGILSIFNQVCHKW